jgi:hypothetical protein
MLKKVSELTKDEKILLLQAIASGELDRSTINNNTLCACDYKDFFLGLIVASTSEVRVVVLGEAQTAQKYMFDNIK